MTSHTMIRVGEAPFSVADVYQWLSASDEDGAIVTFTGKVRNHNAGDSVATLTLEHYPAMTDKVLHEIATRARERWPVQQVAIIHRVGCLAAVVEIVLVGVRSAHRSSAFVAASYNMDIFKT